MRNFQCLPLFAARVPHFSNYFTREKRFNKSQWLFMFAWASCSQFLSLLVYFCSLCVHNMWFAGTDRHSECAHLMFVPFRIEWMIVSRCRTSVGKSTNEIHSVGFAKNNSLDEEKNLAGFFLRIIILSSVFSVVFYGIFPLSVLCCENLV